MDIVIIIASKPDSLRAALAAYALTATVEAEYGDAVVLGTAATLAHHGPRAAAPAPCVADIQPVAGLEAIGVSHFDLDTLGGVLAVLGRKPDAPKFWAAAALVDTLGIHKIGTEIKVSLETQACLDAFWAWSEDNRLFPPRDGVAQDATEFFRSAEEHLVQVLSGDPDVLQIGVAWAAAKSALSAESFVDFTEGVVLRQASVFVNHLYKVGDEAAKAVVAFNPEKKSVTLSLADPVPGVSCVEVAQSLWPMLDDEGRFLAGGHAGIAGSPRTGGLTLVDARRAAEELRKRLQA